MGANKFHSEKTNAKKSFSEIPMRNQESQLFINQNKYESYSPPANIKASKNHL